MMIRASGAQRFRITASDQLKHGLWVADVERLPADMAVPIPGRPEGHRRGAGQADPVAAAKGRRTRARCRCRAPGSWTIAAGWPTAGANCCRLPVQLKQRLMELDNPLVRLELVSDVLTRTGIA